jgi:hypothetical protein
MIDDRRYSTHLVAVGSLEGGSGRHGVTTHQHTKKLLHFHLDYWDVAELCIVRATRRTTDEAHENSHENNHNNHNNNNNNSNNNKNETMTKN